MAGLLAQNKIILKVDLYSLISELLCYTCSSPALHLPGCQHAPPSQIPDRFLHTNKPGCADGCKTPVNRTFSISVIPEMPARFQGRPKGSHVRETSTHKYFSFQAITQAYFNHSGPIFILLPAQSPR